MRGSRRSKTDVAAAVADAVKFAEESPEPAPEEFWTDVYAPEPR